MKAGREAEIIEKAGKQEVRREVASPEGVRWQEAG